MPFFFLIQFMKTLLVIAFCLLLICCKSKNINHVTFHTVSIEMMQFEPDTLTVQPGDTIQWINKDIVSHDVSHFPDRNWHSDTLNKDATFIKVATDSFSYFCSIHPTMRGKILIEKSN